MNCGEDNIHGTEGRKGEREKGGRGDTETRETGRDGEGETGKEVI